MQNVLKSVQNHQTFFQQKFDLKFQQLNYFKFFSQRMKFNVHKMKINLQQTKLNVTQMK